MKFNFFLLLLMAVLLSGYSNSNILQFNDNDIEIELIASSTNDINKSYTIEVSNEGEVEIRNLNFFIYYPLVQPNGSKGNPFKIEGRTDASKPINLKPREKVTYSITAPIKEVFGDSNLLDFNDPQVELIGTVKQGEDEVPFRMSGGYIHGNE
ncbi:hypothetical protein DNH61_03620 [Paenibacillus sambharensis]|uniref:Uncharacterized protein n=1 Tax=Paenibacillus sambharensis TaxID=1803190 RepID=A0A2W1M0J5_9BACL|nr:hypothetical protein [Paenibacillus sambharensis]PZD97237.1 hypothetical protein DNH61_03620 [Paenibacillus sambharensis]